MKTVWIGVGLAAAMGMTVLGVSQLTGDDDAARISKVVESFRADMKTGDCDTQRAAFATLGASVRGIALMGEELGDRVLATFDEGELKKHENAMLDQCEREAYEVCVKQHDFSQIMKLALSRERQAELVGIEAPPMKLLDKCMSFELEVEASVEFGAPPSTVNFESKAKIPLKSDLKKARSDAYVVSGHAPPTVSSRANTPNSTCERGKSVGTVRHGTGSTTASRDMAADEMAFFPDSVMANRLKAAAEKSAAAARPLHALKETIAREQREGKTVSQKEQAERNAQLERLTAEYNAAEAEAVATSAKYDGKTLNKPSRIEFLFDPGAVNANMETECSLGFGASNAINMWYESGFKVAFYDLLDQSSSMYRIVFDEKDIQGGALLARKTFSKKERHGDGGFAVKIIFNLWHRPEG